MLIGHDSGRSSDPGPVDLAAHITGGEANPGEVADSLDLARVSGREHIASAIVQRVQLQWYLDATIALTAAALIVYASS